jgi:hypothetical protein
MIFVRSCRLCRRRALHGFPRPHPALHRKRDIGVGAAHAKDHLLAWSDVLPAHGAFSTRVAATSPNARVYCRQAGLTAGTAEWARSGKLSQFPAREMDVAASSARSPWAGPLAGRPGRGGAGEGGTRRLPRRLSRVARSRNSSMVAWESRRLSRLPPCAASSHR